MKQTLQKIIAVILLLNLTFIIHNSTFAQNVGISATGVTPDNSAMLDVVSTAKGMLIPRVSLTSLTDAATITTPAASLLVYNTNAALTGGTGYYYNAGTTVSPLWVKFLNTGAGTAAADAWLTKGNSGTAWNTNFLGTTDNVSLRVRTNNVQRMIVDSLGNVGIGTTTPTQKLDVKGGALITSNLTAVGSLNQLILGPSSSTNYNTFSNRELRFENTYDAAGFLDQYILYNGFLTGAPPTFTQGIYGSITGIRFTHGGDIRFLNTTAALGGGTNTVVATQEVMTIQKGGNVGIGCTAPQYKLHVIGDIASSATIRGVNAYVTGAITACSDIRYKKDIIPLPNALNNVMKLQGVNYHWKVKEFPEKNFTNDKQIGFIAQEIEKIYPEVVMTDKDGYKSVDYSRLTPILAEAMKEQQKIIDNLKAEIGSLKEKSELRIAKLETAMNLLLQQSARAEIKK